MSNRVNTKERLGINAFENFTNETLGWIFREQTVMDIGIDAQIEQVVNGESTGKLIAIQIKTGLGNVYPEANGNFIYSMSRAHYNYWLSHTLPVIIVLYDPNAKELYRNYIAKRNIKVRNGERPKITIRKDSLCNKNTKSEFEEILRTHQYKPTIDDSYIDMSLEERVKHGIALLEETSFSISSIRNQVDKIDESYNKVCECTPILASLKQDSNSFSKDQIKKLIKDKGDQISLTFNIARTRISNEIPMMALTLAKVLDFIDVALIPEINKQEYREIHNLIKTELTLLRDTMESNIQILEEVCRSFEDTNYWSESHKRTQRELFIVFQDYFAELNDLFVMVCSCLNRLSYES